MSIEDSYAFVHNPKSDIQGIGIKSGKYHGVIYEYQTVSFGTVEDNPDFMKCTDNLGLESDGTLTHNPSTGKVAATGKEVLLSFDYNIIDSFGFEREDFVEQEFGDLLGDILVDVIDKYGTGEQFESDN